MKIRILALSSTISLLEACSGGGAGDPTSFQPPSVHVTAPATATVGSAFIVSWSSAGANSCVADFDSDTATTASVTKTESVAGTKIYSVTCTGANGSTTNSATVQITSIAALAEGLWQGSTGNGRGISGVITKEGNYWLVYTRSANDSTIVGFYSGQAASTETTPPNGALSSSDLREVNFYTGTTMAGVIASATYSAKSSVSGSFDPPVSVSSSSYNVGGTWDITAVLFGSSIVIPMTATSGTYDSATGLGNWHVTADLVNLFPGTVLNFDQTFSLDATSGLGTMNPGTNCTGTGGSAGLGCGGVAGNFVGPINAGGPIVAGVQNWSVLTPVSPTAIVFHPTLTSKQTGLPPTTQDTFNFTTYNPVYETAAALTAVAGSYTAGSTGIDSAIHADASLTVASDGSITGTESVSHCNYSATIAPHATGNVYDVTALTFTSSGGTCVYASSGAFVGAATYDATAKTLTLTALDSTRSKGFMVVATNP